VSLHLVNLDERTRQFMLDELTQDEGSGRVYLSSRLTPKGRQEWASLLRAALKQGDDDSLAAALRVGGMLNETEQRQTPKGGVTTARIPATAAETLAEGEFNRFYIRALCRRVLEGDAAQLIVYRAKMVTHPRAESEAKIGNTVDAGALLSDLRTSQGIDTAFGLPSGPNSGLSVKFG